MLRPYWMPEPTENMRKINLQFFAGEEGDSDLTGDGEETDTADEEERDDEQNDEPERKSFTDDELSKYVAKSTKKAVAKLMRDIGLQPGADMGKVREALTALRGGDGGERVQEANDAEIRARNAERALEAVQGGVPADKAARYVRLAESYMEDDVDDFSEALQAALKDFPVTVPEKKGSAGAGANPGNRAKTTITPGQEAAQRRKDQLKRSKEALENYAHK